MSVVQTFKENLSISVHRFFVTFALYWIFGILFMKFVRRAQGTEMIPNLEFWKELPLVIRVSTQINHKYTVCFMPKTSFSVDIFN